MDHHDEHDEYVNRHHDDDDANVNVKEDVRSHSTTSRSNNSNNEMMVEELESGEEEQEILPTTAAETATSTAASASTATTAVDIGGGGGCGSSGGDGDTATASADHNDEYCEAPVPQVRDDEQEENEEEKELQENQQRLRQQQQQKHSQPSRSSSSDIINSNSSCITNNSEQVSKSHANSFVKCTLNNNKSSTATTTKTATNISNSNSSSSINASNRISCSGNSKGNLSLCLNSVNNSPEHSCSVPNIVPSASAVESTEIDNNPYNTTTTTTTAAFLNSVSANNNGESSDDEDDEEDIDVLINTHNNSCKSVTVKTTPRTMAATLNEQEEQATREFLEIVNGARVSKGISPLSWNAGVKFLMARKFNVRRALELYEQHISTRLSEGLINFDPETEPLKSELRSGKFTVLPSRDLGDAAIAVFTAKLHQPSTIPHEHTLKGVVYQLDAALEDAKTQRCGLVFIYDMSESKYSNFDYDLSIKILSLLKGGYPARLKKVLIVTAPLWFRAPFRILRLFVREKLRDRVFTVSVPQLGAHIPNYALPRSLGGQADVDHLSWLNHCHTILSTTDLWGIFSDESLKAHAIRDMASSSKDDSDAADKEVECANLSNGHQNELSKKLRRNGTSTSQSTPSPLPNSSGSSGFSDDDSLPFEERSGLTLPEFVEHLKQKARRGLLDEYAEIISKNPDGSFNVSRQRGNVSKNRYSDVLCFDHTRVVLSSEGEGESDYINANFVDGYKQKNAFISTQGPLPRTFGDFWKMVWEQTCVVIVMTTRAVERGRTKCGQYWPPDKGSSVTHEGFKIENKEVETHSDFAVTRLKLTNTKTGDSRNVSHLQFLSWPDYGVPSSATAMLSFLQTMREEQALGVTELDAKWDGNPLGPPIVVHCSAGIGRTGTLCTMDICMRRLQDQGTIDVMGSVERIRSQRAYSIQVPEQYLFCHAAMIEYARAKELLSDVQSEGLPDLLAEGDSDSE